MAACGWCDLVVAVSTLADGPFPELFAGRGWGVRSWGAAQPGARGQTGALTYLFPGPRCPGPASRLLIRGELGCG